MTSSPASFRRAIKGGLRLEETHFSGNTPLGQIFSLQPTNQQQQQKQSSPPLSYLEKEAIRTVGNLGTALLHYDFRTQSGIPSGRPFIGKGIGRTRLSIVSTSRGVQRSLTSCCCSLSFATPCGTLAEFSVQYPSWQPQLTRCLWVIQ